MKIHFYNSLTHRKEEFIPLKPGVVGLYTCGPTVYDFQHVGNMRAYVSWDILKRFLQSQNFKVTHIMNITDVGHLTSDEDEGEDKIELAAQRERLTAWQIAEKYFEIFKEDLHALNVIPPATYAKATEHIAEQIALVKVLEQKGYAYRLSDGMYFETEKFLEYGRLGRRDLRRLLPGARVEMNLEKHGASDFALWKFSPDPAEGGKPRQMEWDSPWGKGFPGWHIECSAMSMKYLGSTFDIHTGGIDHQSVHHNNEIAQSQAATGKPLARYWLHNNFLNFKDKKMAKSAGTFVRLADVVAGGVAPLAYRLFLLQTHYRKELCYSWEAIKAADMGLKRLYKEISFFDEPQRSCAEFENKFWDSLADDLNTPKALSVMQKMLASQEPSGAKMKSLIAMDAVLGLNFAGEWERRKNIPSFAADLIAQRASARADKDWKLADILRDKLLELGVEVKDTPSGQQAVLKD